MIFLFAQNYSDCHFPVPSRRKAAARADSEEGMFARVIGKAAARTDSEVHSSGRPIVKYTPSQTAWVLRLTNAAKRGHAAEVQQMCDELAEGFSLDMHDSKGRTALHWAAMKNKANVAYILLDYGASADAERGADGATPLFLAAEVGAKDAAYALLEYEANPDAQRSTDGATPVYIASSNGHLDVVNHLVEFEADVNVTQFSDIRSPPDATAIVKRTGFKPSGSPKKSSSYGIFQKGDKVEVLVGRAREAHWMPGSVTAVYVPTRTNVGHCDMRLIVLGDVEDEDQARRHGMHAHDSKSFEVLKAEDHSEGKGDLTGKHVRLCLVCVLWEGVGAANNVEFILILSYD